MDQKDKRQQIVVKVCCVIVSFILWLFIYNVENPVRERKIVVPVQVINKDTPVQSNLVPIDEDNLSVTLTIKGNASDLYAVKASQFKLVSDLGTYVVKKGENKIPVQVVKSPSTVRIVNSESLWVKVIIEDLKSKNVPVKLSLLGKAKSGFYAAKPELSVNQVKIKGSQDAIQKVTKAEAVYNIQNVSEDVNKKVTLRAEDSLGNVIKNVEIEPKDLDISISVKRIKSVPVNVNISGNLNDYGIKSVVPIDSSVNITGSESQIANVERLNTESIDASTLNGKDTVEARVILPQGVILINGGNTVKLKVNFFDNKSTQKQVTVNIQTSNLDASYNAILSSSTVNLVVTGSQDAVQNLKDSDITAIVDLSGVKEGQNTVPVNISLPDGITKVSQDPEQVSVNISRKNQEVKDGH
ncbi:CdaR family protein [Clostridium sp. JN-1]|uniref:CdaR family protein n=1 Tax=Clostridium sp. JN-1 TaxID=2483110 RepID=UPI000F0B97F6|nr:CdaR family protein [Clostridium sp. JN-1]